MLDDYRESRWSGPYLYVEHFSVDDYDRCFIPETSSVVGGISWAIIFR